MCSCQVECVYVDLDHSLFITSKSTHSRSTPKTGTGSQPKCPDGYVGTGEKDHFNVYDTDGTKHDFCVVPWHAHYRCCETPSSEIGTAKYGYVDTIIAANVIRICGHDTILRTGLVTEIEPTPCEAALALAEERRRRHPLFLWNDPDAGRLLDWPI